ncbi:MAG TPA: hypothetical protein VK668_19215 [Mucilaginibacter sp.]|nr:hypothetical protein [Mucilaginibacter sp.]
MNKPARIRIKLIHLLFFCGPLWFFSCKKDGVKKPAGPACYDYMTIDSNTNFREAPYANYYYYNSDHKLLKHVVTSGGAVAWSDTVAYDHGHVVKSWMSLGDNNAAHYYTRSEYDYTDTLMTGSRYYLGNTLIVHSDYTYDDKGRLASYTQHTDNTTYQNESSYNRNLTYDANDNVTQITNQYGEVMIRYLNYDNYPNLGYKMPFDFAYDIFSYFNAFSKHNVGHVDNYNSSIYIPHDTTGATFNYTYANGKVATVFSGGVLTRVHFLCK